MKTRKREYLNACLGKSIEWLKLSAENQSVMMTRMDVALHHLAIRMKTFRSKR